MLKNNFVNFILIMVFTATIITITGCKDDSPPVFPSDNNEEEQVYPASDPDNKGGWQLVEELSDEFNEASLDKSKWNNDVADWGVWSWEPELAFVRDSMLVIKMIQETHNRDGNEYYYKSGIIRNEQTSVYGYYEARIKGCQRFPGASPAFWMYSVGLPTPTEEGGVQYCEIDVCELQQANYDFETKTYDGPNVVDMNCPARVVLNGELTWLRAGTHPEICKNKWAAPWDAREDFHTYGVECRPDSIIWYVDGIERARKPNLYWHYPMHVTVSMGLRRPFVKYVNGVRYPVPEATTQEGFPTEMYCDYVRVWTRNYEQ